MLLAALLSLVSWLIADNNFRIDKKSVVSVGFSFPGKLSDWNLEGPAANIKIHDQAISISSQTPRWTRLTRVIAWSKTEAGFSIFLGVKGHLRPENTPYTGSRAPEKNKPYLQFYASQLNKKDSQLLDNFAETELTSRRSTYVISDIARIHKETDQLKLTLELYLDGAWKLEEVEVFTFRFSSLYLGTLAICAFLWVVLTLKVVSMYAKRSNLHYFVTAVCLGSFAFLLVVPSSTLWGYLNAISKGVPGLNVVPSISSGHVLAHMIFTVACLLYMRGSKTRIFDVVLLNLMVALAVESCQGHLLSRSSDPVDIALGLLGMSIVLIVFMCRRYFIYKRRVSG